MAEARQDIVVLQNVRLSFPKLWKAEAAVPGSPQKYSASFLIDPDTPEGKANIKKVEAALKYVGQKTWADKAERVMKALESGRKCFLDGESATDAEGDVYSGYEGMMYVKAGNKKRPQVLNRDKTPLSEEDGVIYGGCYVDAVVSFYATTKKEQGGNGMFATLEVVRFRKDGEAFGAAPIDADDYLDDIDDEELV